MHESLRSFVQSLPFFDSHSHMAGFDEGTPTDDRSGRTLPQLLMNDYLAYISSACTDRAVPPAKHELGPGDDAEADFAAALPVLEQCRALSTWAALREGLRALHGFDGADVGPGNWRELNARVVAAYQRHGERAWQREVMRRAGVVRQVQIANLSYVAEHWAALPAAERQAQAAVLLPSLILDGYAFTGFAAQREHRRRAMALLGAAPRTHAEHLAFCEAALDRFARDGGASVKILAAYVRSLQVDPVSDAEAARLYAAGPETLTGAPLKALQDNLLRHLAAMAAARSLPLLVHTGYSIPTAWGYPENLLPLLRDPALNGLRVALCHAGWPHWQEALVMARTYRHIYVDMSWIPLLSPTIARHVLGAALDLLPANKLMMGTDCGSAESFYGAALLARSTLADALEDKVAAGAFDENTARAIARAWLHDNAARFFGGEAAATAP